MDYGRLVSRSFELAWQHKWLWIFGMFAAGAGFNLRVEYLLGVSSSNPFDMSRMENIDPNAILATYMAIIPLIIIMGLMIIFAKAAIIDSVNKIERGGSYSFSTAFSAGIDYFLRFLGLGIISFVVMLTLFLIVGIVLGLIFAINTTFGFLSLFFAFFIIIFIVFTITQIINLAYRVIVLRNSGIMEAISEGVQLFKMHFGKNIALFLIIFALSIAFAIMSFIIWMMYNIPITSAILSLNLTSLSAMLVALLLGLPISFLLGGYFGLFSATLMTLFYIELVEPTSESAYFPQTPQAPENGPDQSGMV